MTTTSIALVDLLGNTRSRIVELLLPGARSVADLAHELGLSEVAVRRHLQVLERDGLVSAETVRRREGPGRPSAYYALTERAHKLFPDHSAEFANELLEFLEAAHGRPALVEFLRWRQRRHSGRYAAAVGAAGEDVAARAARLAEALSEDGFYSTVAPVTTRDGARVLALTQGHCAIEDVAREHPEICAFEAALFREVLGAKVARQQTIAGGAGECVCHIVTETTPRTGAEHGDQS